MMGFVNGLGLGLNSDTMWIKASSITVIIVVMSLSLWREWREWRGVEQHNYARVNIFVGADVVGVVGPDDLWE